MEKEKERETIKCMVLSPKKMNRSNEITRGFYKAKSCKLRCAKEKDRKMTQLAEKFYLNRVTGLNFQK